MRIDTSGNVGIGTTTPGATLEISAGGPQLIFNANTQATNVKKVRLGSSNNTAGDFVISAINDDTSLKNYMFYVNNAGNVGIGTTAPGSPLHVEGQSYLHGPVIKNVYQQDGFFQFATASGGAWLHIKTNIPCSQNIMFEIEAKGYQYSGGQTILSYWCGYAYGGTGSVISNSVTNLGGASIAYSSYTSSDGYVVLLCNIAVYYFGMVLNNVTANPTGQGFNMSVLSYTQTNSSSAAY
jgi:hypothetical protein